MLTNSEELLTKYIIQHDETSYSISQVTLPVPFGPIMALNCLKGPIVCFPLYDLKLSNSMYFSRPGMLLE